MYPDEIIGQAIGALIVVYLGYRGWLKGRKRRKERPYISMRERKVEAERERKEK